MPRNDDKVNRPTGNGGDDSLDFGAFVSSNVQRTSDRLKGDPAPAPDSEQPAPQRPGGDRKIDRARDRSYWRRKAAGAGVAPGDEISGDLPPPQPRRGGRNRYLPPNDEEGDQFHDENEFNDQGGGFGGFFNDFFSGEGEDGNRNRIIAAIAALIILLLIVFGLTQLFSGDDDNGDDSVSTPVATESITAPSTPEEGPTDLTNDVEAPIETDEPEETEIPRGGDNQRGEEEGSPPPGGEATEVAIAEPTSEIARACSGLCLVRMEGPDQQSALVEAEARVSWEDGDISWVVVNPQQADILQRTHTLTLIENDPVTFNLYIVKAAADHNQRDVVSPHGAIIDEVGRYYLVRWSSVPAIVRPVTDWGYGVWKIAPGPPEVIAEREVNGPARDVNGWTILGQVRQDNVERNINAITSIGEIDNTGYGTRYFKYPGNQIAADYLYQELESYGLTVWYEDFIMWDGRLLVNVVAEIPGNDDSEVFGLMAHFDSINLDDARLAPGADDNASGLAVTLETARVLSTYNLEHPVRIALVNAEEEGLFGAIAWAQNINTNGVNMVGVFNIDSVGSVRNRPVVMTNSDERSSWMQRHLSTINNTYGLQERFDHFQTDNIVADDNFVRDEGIPSILIARELYGSNDIHHTVNDVPANMSVGGVVDTCNLVLLAVWELVK